MNLVKTVNLKLKNSFPALTCRDFRYFWLGQCVSLIGTWMQNTGQSWLILTLTNSPFLLGVVNALQFTPVLLFSLFAGVLIDRFPKKKILIFTQISLMVLAIAITILVFTNTIKYWHILILAFLLGCINTIDFPARQAFMIELVGKENLVNAIALNSSIVNGAKFLGPAVAGVLLSCMGFSTCFLINAVSFIPVIYGILKIQQNGISAKSNLNDKNVFKDIKEGLIYIFKRPMLYKIVILISIIGTFALNNNVLIPVYAKEVLNKGSKGFGFLMSALGAGSLIGALTMAVKSKIASKGYLLYVSAFSISIMLMLMCFTDSYCISTILFFIIGFFTIIFATIANSSLQLNSEDEYRGRIMSVYALVFNGVTPIGSLFSGTLIHNLDISKAFLVCGGVSIFFIVLLILLIRKVTSCEKHNYSI